MLKAILEKINLQQILKAFAVLFVVMDVVGCIPIFLKIKNSKLKINPLQICLAIALILFVCLGLGERLLSLYDLKKEDLAAAGSFVLIGFAVELLLDRTLFRINLPTQGNASIVPIAFPLLTGPGSLTFIIALKSDIHSVNICIAILLNLPIVYLVLCYLGSIQKLLGNIGLNLIRKIVGVLLLAMALKTLKKYFC